MGQEEEEKEGRVWMGQRRRLGLYAFVIVFRTAVLLMCLNRVQALVQGEGRAGGWKGGRRERRGGEGRGDKPDED